MNNERRNFSYAVLAGVLAGVWLIPAKKVWSQPDYPSKPIRLVAPFAAGGGTDSFARRVMPGVGGGIGPQIIIDNKPGANSIIATQAVAKAAPDGYTLLLQTNSLVVNQIIQKQLPFDTQKDLVPVSLLARSPHVLLVSNSMPVKTVRELIAYAVSNPRALNYGSGGIGSTNHLAGEMFVKATGIRMEHVAYKGSSEYMRDLTPGVIQLVFAGADQATSAAKLGTARAIATTGTKRLSELPDVPTMEESGFPLQIYSWTGILAPAQTPAAIIDKLAREMQKTVRDPELKKHLPVHDLIGSTPQEFATFLEAERVQVKEIVKSINLNSAAKLNQN